MVNYKKLRQQQQHQERQLKKEMQELNSKTKKSKHEVSSLLTVPRESFVFSYNPLLNSNTNTHDIIFKIANTNFRNETTLDNIEKAFSIMLSASDVFIEIQRLFEIAKKEVDNPCVVIMPGKRTGLDALPGDLKKLTEMSRYKDTEDYQDKINAGFIPIFLFSFDIEDGMKGKPIPEDFQNMVMYLKSAA